MKELSDYIKVFDNIIPSTVCDDIISNLKNSPLWSPAVVGKRGLTDKSIRNLDMISLSNSSIKNQSKIIKEFDDKLVTFSLKAIKRYRQDFKHVVINNDTGYDLLRYNEGCFYTVHTDSFLERPRTVSCSFALNDDYEGGEFAFFDKEIKIKLKKGSVLMFPSNFMYPHEILPVLSGTRYSIITWYV